jgi:hypothetical protein
MPHVTRTTLGAGAILCGAAIAASCGGSHGATTTNGTGGGSTSSTSSTGSTSQSGAGGGSTSSSSGATMASASSSGASTSSGTGSSSSTSSGAGGGAAGLPAGWLYTSGAQIYVSSGNGSGTKWMGRGVNMDDLFLCGYNDTLWMTNTAQTLETMATGLIGVWKPSFIRISLGMDSYPTTASWTSTTNAAQYKTPMTSVIDAIGANAGVYVLVTLRSDGSMIGQDTVDGDAEATGLPSDATTTPDKTTYPTGTDAAYQALVDTFAHASFVLFGLTNEPGGDKLTNAQISAAMSHAVGTIRAEEDKLGVPHHLVSVQGNGWTSDISFYATTPLPYDNVIYEVHGYPPATASYTYASIPVILGEYGSLTDATTFYADVEAKQIPNLAWDFDSYSDCAPDLLTVNQSASTLTPTAWGTTVKTYLLAHAQ